ncbi:hypothetical protein GCM10020367_54890 [Streptomyces sannanensis]|uniref:Uncharacterized protein n=1 Tax=Streptomyces sannanensis TaxID=285536 RepID=A0ABP6SJ08_9ACTN
MVVEGVVRGLVEHRFAVLTVEFLHQPDAAEGRVEDVAAAGLTVQHPHHQVPGPAGEPDRSVDLVGDLRVGDGLPQGAGAEGFLDIDDDQCSRHVLKSVRRGRDGDRPHQVRGRTDPVGSLSRP